MTSESHRLLGEVLKLPSDDRAQIAATLLRSLDEKVDADAEAKWAEVIDRRIAESENGTVELLDWDAARRELDRQLGRDS
ncbi:MAG: addiction module protein [Myxococcota bacterium]